MSGTIASALWSVATASIALSVGSRIGFVSVHTNKIKNENARACVEGILSASDACVNVAFDVGDRVVSELRRR